MTEWTTPSADVSSIANLWFAPQETVMDESKSSPNATDLDRGVYEKLAWANTETEKQNIIDEAIKNKPEDVKLINIKDLLNWQKEKNLSDIDKALAEMNPPVVEEAPKTEEPVKVEEPTKEDEEDYELVDEDIIAEYEALKEYRAENEIQNRAKDKYISQMEDKISTLQEENLNFKASSVILKDEWEQSFIQAKRAYDNEKNDSTKYYLLYTMNRLLEQHGITIKWDIDALNNSKRNTVSTPNVVPNWLGDKSKTNSDLSKYLIRR